MARDLSEEEAVEQGFHGIPDTSVRKKMSAEKLAILLSECEPGRAAYILVEHELNMRLAREQSGATKWAAIYGAIGALAAAGIGSLLSSAPQTKDGQNCVCQWNTGQLSPNKNLGVLPPPTIESKPSIKPIQAASDPKAHIESAAASNAASSPKR